MASMPNRATFYVDIVPKLQGFKGSLQAEVVAAGIYAGWYALEKGMKISYNVELQALSKALARADWLAHGGN